MSSINPIVQHVSLGDKGIRNNVPLSFQNVYFRTRDKYDKEVKAAQQMKGHIKVNKTRTKKPELQTYVPPQRSKKGCCIFFLYCWKAFLFKCSK